MKKKIPLYHRQDIMGYAPIDSKIEIDAIPETVDEAVKLAIMETDNPHLKQWYKTGQGQYWVVNGGKE